MIQTCPLAGSNSASPSFNVVSRAATRRDAINKIDLVPTDPPIGRSRRVLNAGMGSAAEPSHFSSSSLRRPQSKAKRMGRHRS